MTLTRLTRLLVRRPSCALLALTLSTHASVAAQSRGSAATIVNVARLTYTSANGASASDSSASLVTLGTDSLGAAPVQLALSSTVGVVEATLGHAIPYTHTLTNQSDSAIVDLAIRVTLPEGVQLLEETVDVAESMSTNVQSAMLRTRAAVAATIATVDSMRVNGREVTFHAGGPLDPGESWVVRYAVTVVSPPRSTIDKTAIAWASAGAGASLVRSNDGVVSVNLRSGFALESRLIVGKVWLDADRSGRQERAEKGVAGVRVWTADGRMVVTDAQGRFSFRDVAPGRHLLRVDATTLPAGARAATRDGLTTVYMDGWTSARADIALVPAPAAPVPAPTPPHAATRTLPSLEPLNSAVVLEPGVRVRITSPPDDTVVGTNRIYVGVAATAGSPVLLFDGDSLLRSDSARIDGRLDFVAVPLDVGPHLLRVVMRDSTGVEYSDSVRVHQSGPPSRFDVGDIPTLRAESSELVEIAVTVLDEWARPVAGGPLVTVSTEGALSLDGMDADASSLGDQRRVAADGRLTLRARAGQGAGVGTLTLDGGGGGAQSWRHAAGARRTLRLAVLPSVRALAITGSGQVSVGAARADFASLTAIGALGRETSVKITYDSRRDALARGFFARGADPLDETRYAAYGDQSRESALTSGTRQLSVRVERKLDWLEVGDIRTENLLRDSAGPWGIGYRRSLSGASAHFVRGALGVTGFGSVTTQALVVRQIRGDGTSGPFTTVVDIRPGTERIVIEVRARDNAARILTRTELARALDYDIDYAGGVVLLRRAIPAADAYGNPAFLVVSAEQRSGGESRLVAGIRAEGDMTRVFPSWNFDSLTVGATLVRDAAGDAALVGAQPARLVGSDVHMALAGASVRTSLLRAETGDSAATAARMEAEWAPGAWRFAGRWSRVGGGYASAIDPQLTTSVSEARASVEYNAERHSLRLAHERQRFEQYGVARSTTTLKATQHAGARRMEQQLSVQTTAANDVAQPAALRGRLLVGARPDMDLWIDGGRSLGSGRDAPVMRQAQYVGIGTSYRVATSTRLVATHRWLDVPGDSVTARVASLGVEAGRVLGGALRGGVERTDPGDGAVSESAFLGWNQRARLPRDWTLSASLERRFGLDRLSIIEPERALPFAQSESNRWAASAGAEWLPEDGMRRFTVLNEVHRDGGDDASRTGYRVRLGGDAAVRQDLAILALADVARDERGHGAQMIVSLAERALLGVALRPSGTDVVNALFKIEWRDTRNPYTAIQETSESAHRRLIGATEAIWAPFRSTEVAGRLALRWSESAVGAADPQRVFSFAEYAGARVEHSLARRLRARGDVHVLLEHRSGATPWNATPSLIVSLSEELDLDAGYHFGPLRDPDFGPSARAGAFVTLAVRVTERSAANVAAFWRKRVR